MSIFWKFNTIFVALLCCTPVQAATTSNLEAHEDITFSCIEDPPSEYFCTNISVLNPSITLQLPKLERKKISGRVYALRIMPTITNFTKKIIRSARIRLTFFGNDEVSQDFIINQRVIRNSQSKTHASYLIRSDVPSQLLFYNELDGILKESLYNKIILELIEVHFQD